MKNLRTSSENTTSDLSQRVEEWRNDDSLRQLLVGRSRMDHVAVRFWIGVVNAPQNLIVLEDLATVPVPYDKLRILSSG